MSTPDKGITDRVYAALKADPVYFYRHVTVHTENGVVTLSGYVWSTSAMNNAKKIAGDVPGVTEVVNKMALERQGASPR